MFTFLPLGEFYSQPSNVHQSLFDPKSGRGCRLFAFYSNSYTGTSGLHPGIDFYVPQGSSVYSISDGTVVGIVRPGSQDVVSGLAPEDRSGNRFTIIVRYGYTYVLFEHLATITVSVGDIVQAGQQIGQVDDYSEGFGPHLHLEVRTFSQLQSFQQITSAGVDPHSGVFTPQTSSDAIPLLFVNPYIYFTTRLQGYLDNCVDVTYTTTQYPSDAARPNAGGRTLPSNQKTECFRVANNNNGVQTYGSKDIGQCDRPPAGAPGAP